MNEHERAEARHFLKKRELSKTPEGRAALEYARKKREENERRNKILEDWGKYGYGLSQDQKKELKQVQKTAAEARREDILEHFSNGLFNKKENKIMTKFGKIKQVILEYQKQADKHYSSYKAREAEARQKFSEAGFKTEFMQKTWTQMAGDAWSNSDFAINKVMELFDEIEEDMTKWVMRPLDASMIQVLNCTNSFGLRLSLSELKIIESIVRESYWATRLLAGLAQKSGYQVDIPTVDSYQKALETARSNAKLAIRAYAGSPSEGYPGRDLLQKWESHGIVMGEYEPYHLYFASNYLHDEGELDRLEQKFCKSHAPMRYSLTTAEAEKVKKSIEGVMRDGELDKEAAQKLIQEQPDIKDRLESMPNNYFDDKKELVNYFGLNQKVEKEESLISPATMVASEYGSHV